jgi:WASH complex subunit 7
MLIAKIDGINPYKTQTAEINRLLNINTIELFDQNIDIRSEVAQSLNQAFYNINVLNMHDMETYEQMRSLANFQFKLQLMHVYIPSQTID